MLNRRGGELAGHDAGAVMLIYGVTRVRKSHRMTIRSYEHIVLAGPDKKGWHTYQAGSSRFKQVQAGLRNEVVPDHRRATSKPTRGLPFSANLQECSQLPTILNASNCIARLEAEAALASSD